MEIKSLDGVQYADADISRLYALTYIKGESVALYPFILKRQHEMRIDLVSFDMYGSTDYVDAIMDLNGLVNPFAVKEGQMLFYTRAENIKTLRTERTQLDALRDALIDRSKKHKTDAARQDYRSRQSQVEQDKRALPPTVRKEGADTSTYDNGFIRLNPGF